MPEAASSKTFFKTILVLVPEKPPFLSFLTTSGQMQIESIHRLWLNNTGHMTIPTHIQV